MLKRKLHLISDDTSCFTRIHHAASYCGYDIVATKRDESFMAQSNSNDAIFILDKTCLKQYDAKAKKQLVDQIKPDSTVIVLTEVIEPDGDDKNILSWENVNTKIIKKPIAFHQMVNTLNLLQNKQPISVEDLTEAINKKEFELLYLPTVCISTNQIVGCEVLTRWEHPDYGIITPNVFIPLAEENGLIIPLTKLICHLCFAQLASWQKSHLDMEVHMNISELALEEPNIAKDIADIAKQYNITPKKFMFEIPSSIMESYAKYNQAIEKLVSYGFKICLDNFYNQPIHLKTLHDSHISEIKIDTQLGLEMDRNESTEKFVKKLIDVAHCLGMKASISGVETTGAWYKLQEFGCDNAQGYYISRPLSIKEFKWFCP